MTEQTIEERLRTLEARLQELEDDRAIREVLARFAGYADRGQHEDWLDLFTPDGAMDYPMNKSLIASGEATEGNGPGTATPENEVYPRHEGIDQLRSLVSATSGGHVLIQGRSLHFQGLNLRTKITGNTAVAESYSFLMLRDGASYQVISAAAGRWKLEKVDGEWHIRESYRRSPGSHNFSTLSELP